MKYEKYFKELFESITDYRKIVLLKSPIKNDNKFLQECGFLMSDINSLNKEFKNILQNKIRNTYHILKTMKSR